jgi:hypothetical protein
LVHPTTLFPCTTIKFKCVLEIEQLYQLSKFDPLYKVIGVE